VSDDPGTNVVKEPELESHGRRLGRAGWRLVRHAVLAAIPGVLLVVLTNSWPIVLGIAALVVAGCLIIVGVGLLLASLVSRWSARHRSFA
jgi:TRAP-type mannitol/chloroaromatic compound transport system permease large subunit